MCQQLLPMFDYTQVLKALGLYKLPVKIDSKANQAVTEDAGDDEYDKHGEKNKVRGAKDTQAFIAGAEIC